MKPPIALVRHRHERGLLALMGLITLAAFVLGLAVAMQDSKALARLGLSAGDQSQVVDYAVLLLFLPLLPLALWVQRWSMEDSIRTRGLLVDEALFPELHARLQHFCGLLGLEEQPRLLVTAAEIPKPLLPGFVPNPRSIVMSADMAAFSGPDAVVRDFWLARELAARCLGYDGVIRSAVNVVPRLLGAPGKALARAEVYSVDALAAQMLPEGAQDFLLYQGFGKSMYRQIDLKACTAAWARRSRWYTDQLLSDTPALLERFSAIDRILQAQAAGETVVVDGCLL